jgi:septum site-determining protein MinC
MTGDVVVIKGIRQGLLIKLRDDVGWEVCLRDLDVRLGASPVFFREGRIALDVGARELGRPELDQICGLLEQYRVDPWALASTNEITQLVARDLGLVVDLELPAWRDTRQSTERAEEFPGDDLVVRRTIRSGQRLRHPGHVVVIGDVNPGAEIVAGGDIVVWGHARGTLHAGALGDDAAVVCALDLAPMQLRIAGHIARSPEERRGKPVAEMASVREGRIVAVPWPGSD